MDTLPSPQGQRDDSSPVKSPVGVTTEKSPTPAREPTPVMGAVAAKPKAVAQMLSARKMSSFIVSSLATSNEPGLSSGEGKESEAAVHSDIILSLTDVTKEFPLEDNDKIVTLSLGHTHSVFATGNGHSCLCLSKSYHHFMGTPILLATAYRVFTQFSLSLSLPLCVCVCVCVCVCLFTARGRCLTCGANTFGQLGHSMEDARGPQLVKAIVHENVDKVSCGDAFTVATTKGECWEE